MNATLAGICAMLKSQRQELQIAATLVLGELAPKDKGVERELCAILPSGGKSLRLAALEALGRMRSSRAVPYLLPLLETGDEDVRERATQTLIRIGSAAIKPIAKQILDAPPSARRGLLAVLSRVKTADSVRAMMSLVQSGHPEASREAARALILLSQSMSRAEKAKLRSMLEGLLKSPIERTPAGALSAGLMAMGGIGQPGSATTLLKLTSPKYPEAVRRDALLAVSGVLRGRLLPMRVFAGIYPMIQDGPSPALRSAALEVLDTVELPARSLDALLKLLDNPDPAVRRFAARRLGDKGLGGLKAARRLIPLLSGSDPSLREAASESLGRIPESTAPLTEDLLRCDRVHRAWTIAQILKDSAPCLRKPTVRKIFEAAIDALTKDRRVWEPLLFVVRHRDPNLMYEWLMEESARFKKARKYAEAEACLIPLTRGDHFDSEARYALALAGLRASRTRGVASRLGAQSIDLVRQLVRDPAFPLVDRLKKERSNLDIQDLYDLGFRLSEGSIEEKEAGAALLKTVAARAGATKLGRSARNKLRSEGLAI